MDEKRAKLFHLGARLTYPHLWADAIETQWARIDEARGALRRLPPFRDMSLEEAETGGRLTWEAHFLLIAIRQLLRTQDAYFKLTRDVRLTEARAAFDGAIPHAKDFRDLLEHLDEYVLDQGKLQREASSLQASTWGCVTIVEPDA